MYHAGVPIFHEGSVLTLYQPLKALAHWVRHFRMRFFAIVSLKIRCLWMVKKTLKMLAAKKRRKSNTRQCVSAIDTTWGCIYFGHEFRTRCAKAFRTDVPLETWTRAESPTYSCVYPPLHHPRMKYWSCCKRKTSDFNTFLSQEGCTKGPHVWKKEDTVCVFCQILLMKLHSATYSPHSAV